MFPNPYKINLVLKEEAATEHSQIRKFWFFFYFKIFWYDEINYINQIKLKGLLEHNC